MNIHTLIRLGTNGIPRKHSILAEEMECHAMNVITKAAIRLKKKDGNQAHS
jgi:hypothetical protein